MKDNLLPFDLEEAKKDPSRIVYTFMSRPGAPPDKAKEVHFFSNGTTAVLWESGVSAVYEQLDVSLRLTPKRRFVNLYKYGSYENIKAVEYDTATAAILNSNPEISVNFLGTFELMPVKEEE